MARGHGWVQLVQPTNDLNQDVTPLHDREVRLGVRAARGVLRRLLECAHKVWALEEENRFGYVERKRKLLKCAVQVVAVDLG